MAVHNVIIDDDCVTDVQALFICRTELTWMNGISQFVFTMHTTCGPYIYNNYYHSR